MIFELDYSNQEKYILEGRRRYREQMNSQYTAGYTDAEEKCKAELAKKEALIAKKEAEIAEKERLIAEKKAEIAEKERLIAEKKAEIAEKERLIAEKKAEIANMRSKISKLQESNILNISE